MPVLLPNGKNVPQANAVDFAASMGVVQGDRDHPDETAGEAWDRVNADVVKYLRRIYDRYMEQKAADAVESNPNILTDV